MATQNNFLVFSFSLLFANSVIAGDDSAASKELGTPKRKRNPAIVRHIGEGSRGTYVVVDGGSLRRYVIGLDVCFYNIEDEETGCGTIEHNNARAAGVRLPKDKPHRVTEGQRAWSMTWGPLPVMDGFAVNEDSGDVNDLVRSQAQEQEEEQAAEPKEPSLLTRRISYEYFAALRLPVTVSSLKFNAAARASGNGSVWESGPAQNRSLLGFGIFMRLPKPGRWDSAYGFAYNFLAQTPMKTDFDLTDSSQTVLTSVTGHFYRFSGSRNYTLFHTDEFDWLVGAGLEFAVVSHKFAAAHSDGSSLAQGSILNALAMAPVSTGVEWHTGGWITSFAVDFFMPLIMRGNRASGVIGYSEDTIADKSIGAVKDAINPRKNMGFGFKLGLGAKI